MEHVCGIYLGLKEGPQAYRAHSRESDVQCDSLVLEI